MASMWILVSQPGNVVHEIAVDFKAKGQQCLDKVCKILGIHEIDYFGLQYSNRRGENLWLNMRNPIREQLPGLSPYRLKLRFKFPVPPHLLLQDSTRYQLYLNVKEDIFEGKLKVKYDDAVKLSALFIHADNSDFEHSIDWSLLPATYPKWLFNPQNGNVKSEAHCEPSERNEELDEVDGANEQFNHVVEFHHSRLKGMTSIAAQNAALRLVSTSESFGVEYFSVRLDNEIIKLGIGPLGLHLCHSESMEVFESVPFSSITVATQKEKQVLLTHLANNGEQSKSQTFRLESIRSSAAVYRAIIEKHVFYSCETVRNTVTSQYIRDLKGTIASLFNENTPLGKNYVFDIRHTFREVYDNTRRYLYKVESATNYPQTDELKCGAELVEGPCNQKACRAMQEKLLRMEDLVICRLCRDADISIAFFPCRHVITCSQCAEHCHLCPLCRSPIDQRMHIYLPAIGHNDKGAMTTL